MRMLAGCLNDHFFKPSNPLLQRRVGAEEFHDSTSPQGISDEHVGPGQIAGIACPVNGHGLSLTGRNWRSAQVLFPRP